MMRFPTWIPLVLLALLAASPLAAQGRSNGNNNAKGKGPKGYAVKGDRALVITREVLVKQGYLVERVENQPGVMIVWYRAGNQGAGKGKGPLQKMIIRTVQNQIVFEAAPPAVMVDIDVRLRL